MRLEPELQIDEDLELQVQSWRIQRLGWVAMALVLAGGLLGLFGNGPLSRAHTSSPTGRTRIEYERFIRRGSPTEATLVLSAQPQEELIIRVGPALLEHLDFGALRPPPDRVELESSGAALHYRGRTTTGSVRLHWTWTPPQWGRFEAWIQAGDDERLSLQQWIFP